jgi:hypothetical protein
MYFARGWTAPSRKSRKDRTSERVWNWVVPTASICPMNSYLPIMLDSLRISSPPCHLSSIFRNTTTMYTARNIQVGPVRNSTQYSMTCSTYTTKLTMDIEPHDGTFKFLGSVITAKENRISSQFYVRNYDRKQRQIIGLFLNTSTVG